MMLTFILEAALRSMLMALAVWGAIRLLRVQAVLAQKIAWVLVLLAAAAMPLVMHAPWLALNRAVRIPLRSVSADELLTRLHGVEKANPWRKIESTAAPAPMKFESATSASVSPSTLAPAHASPRQTDVPKAHRQVERKVESDTGFTSRVLDFPMAPVEVSVQWPARVTPHTRFWTARRVRLAGILAYFGVVCALLLRTVAGLIVAMRLLRRARPVSGLEVEAGQPMRVRVSPDLTTPVTLGSTVLLPADFADWDAEKLRVVLAHEHSHVRQGDFYLQLIATIHAAIFWFSPLGWWLKRKLSELGEALSDRAALEQAENAASYARVLLEFAATPRRTPIAGVAMARSSNLSSRIERILNDHRFRLAFFGGRRHAIVSAALVPVALVAVVAGFRVVPAVEAARSAAVRPAAGNANAHASLTETSAASSAAICTSAQEQSEAQEAGDGTEISANPEVVLDASNAGEVLVQTAAPVPPAIAPVAPNPPALAPRAPEAPEAPEDAPQPPSGRPGPHIWVNHGGDDDGSFAIVHENGDGTLEWKGNYNDELAQVRQRMNLHGDYIWFERDGKSYIITDPAIVAQANQIFRTDPALEQQQKLLEQKQAELQKRMADFDPEKIKIKVDSPEFKKQMADLNARMAELQSEEFKKRMADLSKQINQEVLASLQQKMGDIQSQIGNIQGQIGEEMGKLGEKQGQLGEQMGKIGEEMGRIGEEQGRRAEEAARRMKSMIDQAVRDGKAKPVD